jgi:hypothetical protein
MVSTTRPVMPPPWADAADLDPPPGLAAMPRRLTSAKIVTPAKRSFFIVE